MDDSLNVNYDAKSITTAPSSTRLQPLKKFRIKLPKERHPKARFPPKYFSAASFVHDGNERNVATEPSPYSRPKDLEEFAHRVMAKAWRRELRASDLKKRFYEKHTNQTRNQIDLLNRLYVKEPELKHMKTLRDVDPEYFAIVEGRPIKHTINIREYVDSTRDVLRTKIVAGYREDDIMQIEESLLLEQKIINEIRSNLQVYINEFEDYLYSDHMNSMNMLRESEKMAAMAAAKQEEYRELLKEIGAIRSVLYNTEEKWRNYRLYQRFLYLVSPVSWRQEHDPYYTGSEDTAENGVNSIFGQYRVDYSGDQSLEDLLRQFKTDSDTKEEPLLYFTEPEQLLNVFRHIEEQNLNSLLHAEELNIPLDNIKETMKQAQELFEAEVNSLSENIRQLSSKIEWEEERAKYLEELAMSLINGEFKKLLTSEEFMQVQVIVEDIYENRIGPNDANFSLEEMMKAVEAKFRELLLKMDRMPTAVVSKLEEAYYFEDARTMALAEEAARKLMEFDSLFLRMNKVFAPPNYRTTRELKWRSPPLNPPKPIPPPPRELKPEELQYLEFFTDYCKNEDDLEAYGINIKNEESKRDDISFDTATTKSPSFAKRL